jgi:hypothetical protein
MMDAQDTKRGRNKYLLYEWYQIRLVPMQMTAKLNILDQLYQIYGSFSQSLEIACQRHCDHCCTSNVTLTTLEGYKLVMDLSAIEKQDLWHRLAAGSALKRYQPRFTINQMAKWCQEGKEIPIEDPHQHQEACPLLEKKECPVYQLRPFACRCFCSTIICSRDHMAEIDPFVLSVNDVFLQYIEHIDASGYSGNLIDVIRFFNASANTLAYKENRLGRAPRGLIANHPLTVLMIPPEHRQRLQPILKAIQEIKVPVETHS